MTFEHPLGRISFDGTTPYGTGNNATSSGILPGLPMGPGKYRHRKVHGRYYVTPDPPTLDAFTTGSLGHVSNEPMYESGTPRVPLGALFLILGVSVGWMTLDRGGWQTRVGSDVKGGRLLGLIPAVTLTAYGAHLLTHTH